MSPVVIKPGGKTSPKPDPQGGNRAFIAESGAESGSQAKSVSDEHADRFHLLQAFHNWLRLVIAPRVFFDAEEGATGFKAPLAVLTAYMLLYYCCNFISTSSCVYYHD